MYTVVDASNICELLNVCYQLRFTRHTYNVFTNLNKYPPGRVNIVIWDAVQP